jgi:uncharacterized low-complexity protein
MEEIQMKKHELNRRLGLLGSAAVMLAALPQAHAADNPFALGASQSEAIVVAEARPEKGISVLEGKCGAGKCGTQRIRQMMDRNGDGKISREEYVSWVSAQAGVEFEEFAKGEGAVGADEVFEHFRALEYHRQG